MTKPDKIDKDVDIEDTSIMCSDLDGDCQDIENHTCCWLYQPEKGICPYLACNTDKWDKKSNAKN